MVNDLFYQVPSSNHWSEFLYLRLYLCGVRSKAAPEKRGNKSKQRNQQVPLLMATVLPSHARLRLRRRLTLYPPTSRPEKHPSFFFNAVHFKDTSSLLFPTTTTRASLFPSATTTTSHQPVARRFRVLCVRALQFLKSIAISHATKCVCWAANIRHLSQFQHCY